MLGLVQFEIDAYWAPTLDKRAQFERKPLVRKQFRWFERTPLHATKVRNVYRLGSQFFKHQAGFELYRVLVGPDRPWYLQSMVSKLLDDNTANIEKAKSLTAGLSAAQMSWRPQPGKWSMAQNLDHLNAHRRQADDTIASCIAAARAKGIIGNGPFRYGWLSSWLMKSMEPPPKRKFKTAKSQAPSLDVDASKAVADYLCDAAHLTELIQKADGLDLARVKTPFLFKWVKISLGALLAHVTTHDRRHLWQAEQVRNDPNSP